MSNEPIQKDRKAEDVPIADVIAHFIDERIPPKVGSEHKPLSRPDEVLKYMEDLLAWWGDKTADEVDKTNCRKFTEACRSPTAARNRLEYLRGALNLAHKDGILRNTVMVHLPSKPEPRSEFLERDEVAKLLWHAYKARRRYTHNAKKSANTGLAGQVVLTDARPWRHVARYILVALYTGTRKDRIVEASFVKEPGKPWIDLKRGEYHRAAQGEVVAANKRAPTIRIPRRLLSHMRRWYKLGARYPVELNGKKAVDTRAFATVVKAVFGDRKIVGHTLRHTTATWLMRQPELSIHDISGYLGMSLEVLERVYGKHRTHHQKGIDSAISKGQLGKDKFDVDDHDGWNYDTVAPTDTDRMKQNQVKRDNTQMSKRSMKTKKPAVLQAAE
ncbi:integrase [Sinorhizobium meliloti]|uniref:integrase n=1 Tax=Rhizobium meliloti TaxID=382 RepID=UPI000FDB797F|nr:integrase [Sinorhizobium meliloti]RVM58375.1 integrase [Sinorhizobium meliloti]